MNGSEGPSRVGEIIGGVLDRAGVRGQIARQGVLAEWDAAVGERIAAVTRPARVDEAVLFVEVRSSAWLMELNMMKRQILERVNEGRTDGIEQIRFLLAEKG